MMADHPRLKAFANGLADSASIAAGYFPIAFAFGVLAARLGVGAWEALLISCIVFAGASQFVMVTLIAAGSSMWTVVGAVLLMNLRHLFYGPSISRGMGTLRLPKALLAFGLTDEVFATAIGKLGRRGKERPDLWLLGLELGAYSAWIAGTAVGALAGVGLGEQPVFVEEALRFILPALFFALLLEIWQRRHVRGLAVALGATLAANLFLPSHGAMIAGMVAGAAAAIPKGPRA